MTPAQKKSRIDRFTRWMVKAEAKQRRENKALGYDQTKSYHCGAPACIGGWSDAWAAAKRCPAAVLWDERFDLTEEQAWREGKYNNGVFGIWGCNGAKTALGAANYLRRMVKLPALKKSDCGVSS